jgi:hypothetical protein
MYRFYQRATVCFAYLRDVTFDTLDDTFVKSEWFTRGWTLQELLAPTNLEFYDRYWNLLGTKQSLCHFISAATRIPEDVLLGKRLLRGCSAAERMSWAASRETTRIEDRAYSLLGMFDVNMTMLYGEGSKSFVRLQEEILKTLDDHSIFVWKGLQPGLPGLLASSPEAFASSGDVKSIRDRKGRRPFTVNNRGVHGLFRLFPYTLDTYLMVLPCIRRDSTDLDTSDGIAQVGIFLRQLYEDDQFMRVSVHGEEVMNNATACVMKHGVRLSRTFIERSISIRQSPLLPEDMADVYVERIQGFRLNESLVTRDVTPVPVSTIGGKWDPKTQIISLPPGSPKIDRVGSLNIGRQEREIELIRFGFDHDYNPIVYLIQKDAKYAEHGWSQYRQLSDGKWVARMSPNFDGCWALKADRIDRLDVHIVRTDKRPDGSIRLARIGRVRLQRMIIHRHLIWVLHIDELAPRGKVERSFLQDNWPQTNVGDANEPT